MGAGISKRLMNARIYRQLRKIQAELDAAGVCSRYKRLQLRGWDDVNLEASWVIYFDAATLSNGDTWGSRWNCDDRDGGADPGEEGPLVGGMVAEAADHGAGGPFSSTRLPSGSLM